MRDTQEQSAYWKTRHEPIVYYMVHEKYKGAIKIGTTVNQETRIAKFRTQRGDDGFFILAKEPGDAVLERKRHKYFDKYRIEKDWYFFEGELRAYVLGLVDQGFQPAPDVEAA